MSESGARLLEELAGIQTYLTAAQEVLKNGFMPDITSLDKRVADLCKRIVAANDDARQQCLPGLSQLLHSLDDCERGIREWHEAAVKIEAAK